MNAERGENSPVVRARQPHETVASAVSDLDDAAYSAWLHRTLAEGRAAVEALAEG